MSIRSIRLAQRRAAPAARQARERSPSCAALASSSGSSSSGSGATGSSASSSTGSSSSTDSSTDGTSGDDTDQRCRWELTAAAGAVRRCDAAAEARGIIHHDRLHECPVASVDKRECRVPTSSSDVTPPADLKTVHYFIRPGEAVETGSTASRRSTRPRRPRPAGSCGNPSRDASAISPNRRQQRSARRHIATACAGSRARGVSFFRRLTTRRHLGHERAQQAASRSRSDVMLQPAERDGKRRYDMNASASTHNTAR